MAKNIIDHGHGEAGPARAQYYSLMDRIKAGEGAHPKIRLLDRRKRKGMSDASRVKQFLRIERGYLA